MELVHRIALFKREHRVHYWIRLLLFAYCLIVVGYLVGSDLVEGAPASTTVGVIHNTKFGESSQAYMAINPNGTWQYVWCCDTTPHSMIVSYSEDEGSNWTDVEVIASGWGHAGILPYSIHCTANNSTIVYFYAGGKAGNTYEHYVGVQWANSTSWIFTKVFGNDAVNPSSIDASVNSSHMLMTHWRSNTKYILYKLYDFQNDTFDPGGTSWTIWHSSAAFNNPYPKCTVDVDGEFWLAFQDDGEDIHIRDLDEDVDYEPTTSPILHRLCDFNAIRNGQLLWLWEKEQGGTYYLVYNHIDRGGTGFQQKTIYQTTNEIQLYWASLSHTMGNAIHIFCYDKTDDNIYGWTGAWNASEGSLQATIFTAWGGWSGGDYAMVKTWTAQYPRFPDGNATQIAISGWLLPYIVRDVSPTPDYTYYRYAEENIKLNEYEWFPPVTPPVTTPTDAGTERMCESGWLVFIVVFVILFGLLGVFARSTL